jgi:ABC-type nitrate/sulfonate/bicarbonate transport system permease component
VDRVPRPDRGLAGSRERGAAAAAFHAEPAAVIDALQVLWTNGTLAQNLGASLGRIIPGWIIGTAAGLAAGLAMALFSAARAAGLPIVSALFPIPKIALLPLLIHWFGIGAFVLAAGNLMQTDQLLAGTVVLSILALLIFLGLGTIERSLLRWR